MTLNLSIRPIIRALAAIVILLMLAHVVTRLVYFRLGAETVERKHLVGVLKQFNLDEENNIPVWYQSSALLFSAAMLAVIAASKRKQSDPYARHWTGLTIIFLALSLDETASLHNMTARPLNRWLHMDSGFLFQAWVILGFAFVAVFAILYASFLRHLASRKRTLFLLSGVLYVAGAAGMEIINVPYGPASGPDNMTYAMLTLIEESLEMAGILLFNYTLLIYLGKHVRQIDIRVSSQHRVQLPEVTGG